MFALFLVIKNLRINFQSTRLRMKNIILLILLQFSSLIFAQPGSLDNTFDNGPSSINYGIVYATIIQPDGKIIVGGSFFSTSGKWIQNITRLNPDGSLDMTFNTGTGANDTVKAIVLQQDGKIIIGGEFYNYNGTRINRIARLNSDGSIDTSFNPGQGPNDDILNISLQNDGKIIIGGYLYTYNGSVINRMARLNTDGSLDTTFNLNIIPTNWIQRTLIQPDGKILIAGSFNYTNGRIARLNADGSLDSSFNIGSTNDQVESMLLQPDGKIILGGQFLNFNGSGKNNIIRFNSDGSIDTSFNLGLNLTHDNGGVKLIGSISTMSIQPDGKIIIGGWFDNFNGTVRNNIARLNVDGSLDQTFAPITTTSTSDSGAGFNVTASVIQSDGKIIIGGQFTTYDGIPTNIVIRLNNNLLPPIAFAQSVCFNATISDLTALGANLKWYETATSTTPLASNVILVATTYYVSQTVGGIESDRTMVPVTINTPTTPTFTPQNDICPGTTLLPLPTISNNNIAGSWSPALNNTQTTLYTFTPEIGSCATTATMTITVNSNVIPTFAPVMAICSGDIIPELPTTSNNFITGTWAPPLNNTTTTTYTFTPNTGSCTTTTTMTIAVMALPDIEQNHYEIICSGQNDTVQLNAGLLSGSPSQYSYQWFRDNQLLPSEQEYYIAVNQEGIYTCNVKKKITGCERTRTNTVVYSKKTIIEKVIIKDLSENNTITVLASGMENSEYSLDNPTNFFQDSNVFENVEPGIHTAYVNDKNGCGITSKTFAVLGAPLYFSPNGDGYNDRWTIKGINELFFKNSKVQIFDRYGKLIKELSAAANEDWDGTYNGNPLPATDYWYIANIDDGRIIKGHFALKR